MFTGLVEVVGTVESIRAFGSGKRLQILAPEIAGQLELGESISVSGACLTVVLKSKDSFEVEVVQETLSRTTLKELSIGNRVNLERSLRALDRLGGHFVQGHVDGVGTIEFFSRENDGNFRLSVHLPEELRPLAVEKGSIAIDGVSLTVAKQLSFGVEVALIPFTVQHTTFQWKKRGDHVNVEMDLLGKYVFSFLKNQQTQSTSITEEWLRRAGF